MCRQLMVERRDKMQMRSGYIAICLLSAALLGMSQRATAQIIKQDVTVAYSTIFDTDHTEGDDSGDLHDILAELTGPRYRGFAAAGVFGDVGTSLGLLTAPNTTFHSIRAVTQISADPAFVNLFAFPVHVYSDFILDGGD